MRYIEILLTTEAGNHASGGPGALAFLVGLPK